LTKEHPNRILLRKFSTQGSALTFPVQSIVFAILAVWALRLHDGKEGTLDGIEESFREVTVFGDDIILPTRALSAIKLVLHEVGLKVNASKTFGGLNFRESCGCDAFKGYDVTPAYALRPYDASPSAIDAVVKASNNFFLKGYWHGAEAIALTIPAQERKLLSIVGESDGSFGLTSYTGTDRSHLKGGWDHNLHRTYSIALAVTSKVTKERGRGDADLVQYFTERPSTEFQWQAGQVKRIRLRKGRVRVHD
jgi:hypothetical protein